MYTGHFKQARGCHEKEFDYRVVVIDLAGAWRLFREPGHRSGMSAWHASGSVRTTMFLQLVRYLSCNGSAFRPGNEFSVGYLGQPPGGRNETQIEFDFHCCGLGCGTCGQHAGTRAGSLCYVTACGVCSTATAVHRVSITSDCGRASVGRWLVREALLGWSPVLGSRRLVCRLSVLAWWLVPLWQLPASSLVTGVVHRQSDVCFIRRPRTPETVDRWRRQKMGAGWPVVFVR